VVSTATPHVSIVTPVFNEETYLAECIESVLSQTYPCWDLTIVDNCSTDRSFAIAQSYAARDSRIRVLRNDTFLQSLQNCNAAVRQISPHARYCKVVLADDWIYPECLERMVALAEANPSIGIVGAYALEGERVTLTGLSYKETLLSGREVCRRHLLEGLWIFGSQTSVLYRSDLVRKRDSFYDESNIHGDTDVCFVLLKESDFGFVHQVLTFTRVRPGSVNTKSRALQTSWGSDLHLLTTHGPDCLTPSELQIALDRHVFEYYKFLGKSLLRGRRDERFWSFHKAHLAASGIGFRRYRVAFGMIAAVAETLSPARLFTSRSHIS
jgi:glycosyltransferase involved in cell wall biosynthesis